MSGDEQPHWRLPPAAQKLSTGLSNSLSNNGSLKRVSSTLQDVKRNGELLLNTAQSALQNGLAADDWALLRRVGGPSDSSTRSSSSMRRVQSEVNLQRAAGRLRVQRLPAPAQQQQQLTREQQQRQADAWDWLSALNTTLNQARTVQQTRFNLPRTGLEEQAKQLVRNTSSMSLTEVKDQLLQKPKLALNTAAQTLENCQQNLQSLQTNLQQSLADGRTTLGRHLSTLGEPGSPSTSSGRLASLLSPTRLSSSGGTSPTVYSRDEQGDVSAPWSLLAGPLRGRDAAAVEALVTEDEDGEQDDEAEGSGRRRNWGPFQRRQRWGRQDKDSDTRSSLREDGRQVLIVTTAALPWMTGTAVNPLLRAAYLARDRGRKVTLMIPWLAKADQSKVFPNNTTFDTPEQQEEFVREWVKKRTGFDSDFKVTFYPGRYAPEKCSILPVGDPTQYVPDHEADVAILEEPEHLNWYHHGKRWTDKFSHVVGVVHTNYLDYARREECGDAKEFLLKHINSWVCRIHCHKVVKLSDAVQTLPKQTTEFVHGVAESFLEVGKKKAEPAPEGTKRFNRGAYFIGKVVWGKGYTELLELMTKHTSAHGDVAMDCYGTGEDLEAVKDEAASRHLGLRFHGAKDHLDESMHEYQVFINPSTSDVVATTTAEALAMGKWVVCADHPSNQFFSQFKNCLIFKTPEEFSQHVEHALSHEPHPMVPEERQNLTWEAATERFLDVTELTAKDLKLSVMDNILYSAHRAVSGVEPIRTAVGAGTHTRDNPQRITDYQPATSDVGGLFDNRSRAVKAHAGPALVSSAAAAAALNAQAAAPAGSQLVPALMRTKQRA